MSRTLELPDDVYEAIAEKSREIGMEPVDVLRETFAVTRRRFPEDLSEAGRAKLERFKHIIGGLSFRVRDASKTTGEEFTDILVEKAKQGHL